MSKKIEESLMYSIKSSAETMENWIKVRDLYAPIVKKLEALGSDPSYSGYLYASLSGDKALLTKAIRALRTSGLKGNEKPKANEPSFSSWYNNEDSSIRVYLSFSSTVCRRVKVRTEMQEVDVYEIQCTSDESNGDSETPVTE